jgi:hypothetical protein
MHLDHPHSSSFIFSFKTEYSSLVIHILSLIQLSPALVILYFSPLSQLPAHGPTCQALILFNTPPPLSHPPNPLLSHLLLLCCSAALSMCSCSITDPPCAPAPSLTLPAPARRLPSSLLPRHHLPWPVPSRRPPRASGCRRAWREWPAMASSRRRCPYARRIRR